MDSGLSLNHKHIKHCATVTVYRHDPSQLLLLLVSVCLRLWCHHVLQCQQLAQYLSICCFLCLLVCNLQDTHITRDVFFFSSPLSSFICLFISPSSSSLCALPMNSPLTPPPFLLTEMAGNRGSSAGRTPSIWSRARPRCLFFGSGYGFSEDWLKQSSFWSRRHSHKFK